VRCLGFRWSSFVAWSTFRRETLKSLVAAFTMWRTLSMAHLGYLGDLFTGKELLLRRNP